MVLEIWEMCVQVYMANLGQEIRQMRAQREKYGYILANVYKWQMCHAQKRASGAQREIRVDANAHKRVRLRIGGKIKSKMCGGYSSREIGQT